MTKFRTLEEQLFNSVIDLPRLHPEIVFIVGAPRTGSTLLYLLMIRRFKLSFFPNFVNDDFHENPAVGMLMWLHIYHSPLGITLENRYGHTVGPFQPSEGTRIFKKWFEDPAISQHLSDTLDFLACVLPAPLVIKNAWNCFRITRLAAEYPSAKFVWARRGLEAAAISDLSARYVTQGSPSRWTPVVPPNAEKLSVLPYAQQVVENQRSFEQEICHGLWDLDPSRWTEVWYEKLIEDNDEVLRGIGERLGLPDQRKGMSFADVDEVSARPPPPLPEGDVLAVKKYAARFDDEELQP